MVKPAASPTTTPPPIVNKLAGDTGRSGFGGLKRRPTSWQHKLGGQVSRATGSPWFGRAGKFAGRAALVPTIFEGFYDIGAIARCAFVVGDLVRLVDVHLRASNR